MSLIWGLGEKNVKKYQKLTKEIGLNVTCDEVLPFLSAETNSLFTELCG